MGGGWVGYVYVLLSCGFVVLLLGGSTAVLYAVAKVQKRRGEPSRVRVRSVSSSPASSDAISSSGDADESP